MKIRLLSFWVASSLIAASIAVIKSHSSLLPPSSLSHTFQEEKIDVDIHKNLIKHVNIEEMLSNPLLSDASLPIKAMQSILRTYSIEEFVHYPKGDLVIQNDLLYYFHSHRESELGHFHVFVKNPNGGFAHLIAISMDRKGLPVKLFTTNTFVTQENPLPTTELISLLEKMDITIDTLENTYITALLKLFSPQIVYLLHQKDKRYALDEYQNEEILSELTISLSIQRDLLYELKEAPSDS